MPDEADTRGVELKQAIQEERAAAHLDGYFGGSGGTREKYEAAKATTDATIAADTRGVHECKPCRRMFKTEAALVSHERWRHNYGCPICTGGTGSVCSWHFL